MSSCNEVAIILAAGKGTRMGPGPPKVLARLCGRPMIEWVINAVSRAGIGRILVVVGHGKEEVVTVLEGLGVDWVEQPRQLGTGHALKVACATFEGECTGSVPDNIVVLLGDSPLIRPDTILALVRRHREASADATLATAHLDDPCGYGRVVRDGWNRVIRVVEELDASEGEAAIKEVNSGLYCFRLASFTDALERLVPDNNKGEYYLTQVVEILSGMGKRVEAMVVSDPREVLGVNSQRDLERVSRIIEEEIYSGGDYWYI